jgi:hypothetical protein
MERRSADREWEEQSGGRGVQNKKTAASDVGQGCARTSISGAEWRARMQNAPGQARALTAPTAAVKDPMVQAVEQAGPAQTGPQRPTARLNRKTQRELAASVDGIREMKLSQLTSRKKELKFVRSKIHDWGIVTNEAIEMDDFVIEYIGQVIRKPVRSPSVHCALKCGE